MPRRPVDDAIQSPEDVRLAKKLIQRLAWEGERLKSRKKDKPDPPEDEPTAP